MMKVTFKTSNVTIEGELNDSQTAQKIYEKLPINAEVETWGNKPRPASEVNIVGKVASDISALNNIKSGDKITVAK